MALFRPHTPRGLEIRYLRYLREESMTYHKNTAIFVENTPIPLRSVEDSEGSDNSEESVDSVLTLRARARHRYLRVFVGGFYISIHLLGYNNPAIRTFLRVRIL